MDPHVPISQKVDFVFQVPLGGMPTTHPRELLGPAHAREALGHSPENVG